MSMTLTMFLVILLLLNPGPHQMQPSNTVACKLYRCIECMRDISEILGAIQNVKARDKRRRRLKLLFTPLFSFVDSLVDLLHDIQSNPQTKNGLPHETVFACVQT